MELCSLPVIYLGSNYGGGNEDNGDLLQKVPGMHCYPQFPDPAAGHHQPMPQLETPGHSWGSLGHSPVGSLLLSPGSLCIQCSVCTLQEAISPVLCMSWLLYCGVNGDLLQEGLCHTQACCTQSLCSRPLLTHTSTGDTQTQFWLSLVVECAFWPFPGLSSSGNQVFGEHTVPGVPCILITSPVPAT